jgi:hypothetical protein
MKQTKELIKEMKQEIKSLLIKEKAAITPAAKATIRKEIEKAAYALWLVRRNKNQSRAYSFTPIPRTSVRRAKQVR